MAATFCLLASMAAGGRDSGGRGRKTTCCASVASAKPESGARTTPAAGRIFGHACSRGVFISVLETEVGGAPTPTALIASPSMWNREKSGPEEKRIEPGTTAKKPTWSDQSNGDGGENRMVAMIINVVARMVS